MCWEQGPRRRRRRSPCSPMTVGSLLGLIQHALPIPPSQPIPRWFTWGKDTIQVIMLNPHKTNPAMSEDGRKRPFFFLFHKDGHEMLNFRHVHIASVISANENLKPKHIGGACCSVDEGKETTLNSLKTSNMQKPSGKTSACAPTKSFSSPWKLHRAITWADHLLLPSTL